LGTRLRVNLEGGWGSQKRIVITTAIFERKKYKTRTGANHECGVNRGRLGKEGRVVGQLGKNVQGWGNAIFGDGGKKGDAGTDYGVNGGRPSEMTDTRNFAAKEKKRLETAAKTTAEPNKSGASPARRKNRTGKN